MTAMWHGSYWGGGGGVLSTAPSVCLVLRTPAPCANPRQFQCPPPPLHCHDGATYTKVWVADALFVFFLEAHPAPPLYFALTLLGMDEWPEARPPVPPPPTPDPVDDAASDSGASSCSDASSHRNDPLE